MPRNARGQAHNVNYFEEAEALARLTAAYESTDRVVQSLGRGLELHLPTALANLWPLMAASYCGLEQALKTLLRRGEDGHEGQENQRRPPGGHNLAVLFEQVRVEAKTKADERFAEWASLHSYTPWGNISDLLQEASLDGGGGYERWRYALTEDQGLPPACPQALLAVWNTVLAELEATVHPKRRAMTMPVHEEIEAILEAALLHMPDDDEAVLRKERQARKQNLLDMAAELLWEDARYGAVEAISTQVAAQTAAKRWTDEITRWTHDHGPTSIRVFVERAQGHFPDGSSIRWNSEERRFVKTPWSLESRYSAREPEGSTVLKVPSLRGTQPTGLWKAARGEGYSVAENRSFEAAGGKTGFCKVLEVYDPSGETERTVLSMWQLHDEVIGIRDRDLYWYVPGPAMCAPLRPLGRELRYYEAAGRGVRVRVPT